MFLKLPFYIIAIFTSIQTVSLEEEIIELNKLSLILTISTITLLGLLSLSLLKTKKLQVKNKELELRINS